MRSSSRGLWKPHVTTQQQPQSLALLHLVFCCILGASSALVTRQGLLVPDDFLFSGTQVEELLASHAIARAAASVSGQQVPQVGLPVVQRAGSSSYCRHRVLLCASPALNSAREVMRAIHTCGVARSAMQLGAQTWTVAATAQELECIARLTALCGACLVPAEAKIAANVQAAAPTDRLLVRLVPGQSCAEFAPDRVVLALPSATRDAVELRVASSDLLVLSLRQPVVQSLQAVAHVLGSHPAVDAVELEQHPQLLNYHARWITQSGAPDELPFSLLGLDGSGEVIGVGDTGIDTHHPLFADPTGLAVPFRDWNLSMATGMEPSLHRKIAAYVAYIDGIDQKCGHGTHVVGTLAGHNNSLPRGGKTDRVGGIASGARIAFVDLGNNTAVTSYADYLNGETIHLPHDTESGLYGLLFSIGARVQSHSWGVDDSAYTSYAQQADSFLSTHEDASLVFAAGNNGECGSYSVVAPALAKNAIAVGATLNSAEARIEDCTRYSSMGSNVTCSPLESVGDIPLQQNLASFSSWGPATDERLKVRRTN